MKAQLRRIALVLLLALGVELLSPPARVLSQGPAPAESLPLQGAGVRVAAVLMRLERDLQDLVDTADKPGGLLGWREAITPHQLALLQLVPATTRELDAFGDYLSQQGFALALRQRHEGASGLIADRLQALLVDLTDAVHQSEPEQAVPILRQALARLRSWRTSLPAPPLPDVLPFGPSRTPAPIASVPEPAAERDQVAVPIATDFPAMEDWGQGPSPDEDRVWAAIIAETGGSVPALARWVYEHVRTEWYAGHVRTPVAVARQEQANDVDATAFTVALLRAAGHPARYARGRVTLGPDEWEMYLGFADGDAAARFLAATGRDVTRITDATGHTRELWVTHWWIEAYDLEADRWLALDPSWKPLSGSTITGPARADILGFDLARYLYGDTGKSPLETLAAAATAAGPEGAAEFASLPPGELPVLPFRVVGEAQSTDALPVGTAAVLEVTLGDLSVELPLSDVVGQPLTLEFAGATEADQQVLDTWNESFFPGHLVQLRPVLQAGRREVGAGAPLAAGERRLLTLSVRMGQLRETVQHAVAAGNLYSIVAGPAGTGEPAEAGPGASFDVAGGTLQVIGRDYLTRVNADAGRLGALTGIRPAPGAQVAIGAYELDHAWLAGYPYFSWVSGVRMDAARLAITPVHPQSSAEHERLFSVLLGAQAAWRESRIFTEAFGLPPEQSTVPLLSSAIAEGTPLYWVCRLNGDRELPETDLTPHTRARLGAAFDRGWLLAMPPGPVHGDEAYILIDPVTGASGYYLGDGSNGTDLKFPSILKGKPETSLLGGRWIPATATAFSMNFALPAMDIYPPVVTPAPPPSAQGFGVAQMKPAALPQISCLEATQVLPPAIQQELKGRACEQARIFLQGFASGLKDGMVFGVEAAWNSWSHVNSALAAWQRFYDHPGEVIAELSAQAAALWEQRQEIVGGLLAAFSAHIQQRSGMRAGDAGLVIWGFGYATGFVAGLFFISVIPDPSDLILGSAAGVVIIGGRVLYKLAVTRLAGPVFGSLRNLTSREAAQGLLQLARTLVKDQTGSVNLGALLRRLPDFPSTANEFLFRTIQRLSQIPGHDVARLLRLSTDSQEILAEATVDLVRKAEKLELDLAQQRILGRLSREEGAEYAVQLYGTRARLEQALEFVTTTSDLYAGGLPARSMQRVLGVHGLSVEDFRLLQSFVEYLSVNQLRALIAARNAVPERKILVKLVRYGSPDAKGTFLWMLRHPDEAMVGGFVTFREHLKGLKSSGDYIEALSLVSPAAWGFGPDEMIAEIRIPIEKLRKKFNIQLEVPWHSRLHELIYGRPGGLSYSYPFQGTGFTANGVPEWRMRKAVPLTQDIEGIEIMIRGPSQRGWVATLSVDKEGFRLIHGRLP